MHQYHTRNKQLDEQKHWEAKGFVNYLQKLCMLGEAGSMEKQIGFQGSRIHLPYLNQRENNCGIENGALAISSA